MVVYTVAVNKNATFHLHFYNRRTVCAIEKKKRNDYDLTLSMERHTLSKNDILYVKKRIFPVRCEVCVHFMAA